MDFTSRDSKGPRWRRLLGGFFASIASVVGASVMTAVLFLVLPIINNIAAKEPVYDVIEMPDEFVQEEEDEVIEEPEEEEEEEEVEEEEPPPEFEEEVEPLSLADLESALSGNAPGVGDGGVFDIGNIAGAAGDAISDLANLDDLGGKPRPKSQPGPSLSAREAKVTPGRATVKFVVDQNGRVQTPILKQATHPLLGQAALRTIKKWRFYPAMRDGKPVRKAVSQTIEFQKQ